MPAGRPPKIKQTEQEKLEKQFDEYDARVKELTQENMDKAPIREEEAQTKLSNKEMAKQNEHYLKPTRTISSREKFNEKFRDLYENQKQYVPFIAENKEVIGESITMWTKPFPGMSAEMWEVPVNKRVFGPKYVANQIAKCTYHRLKMEDKPTQQGDNMTFYGQMVVEETVHRLNANKAELTTSVSMGKFD